MPATLPQLSRRKFLKYAAVAGAAAALAPQSYAGLFNWKKRDPHTFVVLSDSHIAADLKATRSGVNMADNLGACVLEIVKRPIKPAATIVNGDLAFNLGRPDDYAAFGHLIHPLRSLAPVHLSLGNHDERTNFWAAFPKDAAHVNAVPEKQVTMFASERANWFLLDSLDITMFTPGRLGQRQLDWLSGELAAHPEKPALVVCHHPLDPTGKMGLKDSVALDEILMEHTHVKAFIFGHTHNWNIEPHPTGVHLINLPQTAYPFQPGRPSGWVRATLARDGMELELRCLDHTHPEHGQITRLKWRPT